MNIAYTLKLLGEAPTPFVYVARDFDKEYADHLQALAMDTSGIQRLDAPYSAHAFIFTDSEQNQFTGFYGGPSPDKDLETDLRRFAPGFDYGILAPDLPVNMIAAARAMRQAGVPFLADPGQNLTDFRARDAIELVELSDSIIVNEFEYTTLHDFAGERMNALDLLVVTEGGQGARWRSKTEGSGRQRAGTARVVDPTGCGDAFRGGFVHARIRGASLGDAVKAGAVTAAIALESAGTQTHRCDDFRERYQREWGDPPEWIPAPRGSP